MIEQLALISIGIIIQAATFACGVALGFQVRKQS